MMDPPTETPPPCNALLPGVRDQLARSHLWLARYWAYKYRDRCYDRDDLLSWANYGLAKATMTWKPDGGASFRWFATICVRRYVRWGVKLQRRHGFYWTAGAQPTRLRNDHLQSDRGRMVPTLYEELTTVQDDAPGKQADLDVTWAKLMDRLRPCQREFVRLRFREGLPLSAVGRHFERTREWARLEETRILGFLRGLMAGWGETAVA